MKTKINLSEQTIDNEELIALANWIKTNPKLTKGELTKKFESEFSGYIDKSNSVFVNSGSSANLLMAHVLKESGRLKNNIIIAPSVSWVTTVAPFMQLNYDVHLCDCNLINLGLDLNEFENLCRKLKPSVVITCNVLGHANDYDEILSICKKYDVILIEDNCESLGSTYKNKKLGSIGLMSSHSFYYGHHISTIEGGMVSTNDDELFNLMLSIRSHGWNRDMTDEYKKKYSSDDSFRDMYTFYFAGLNIRSTDLSAFIGLSQIKKIDYFRDIRESNFKKYQEQLNGFWSQKSNNNSTISSFAYGTLVKNPSELYKYLSEDGIDSRPLICGNIARHPFWKSVNTRKYPNSDVIHNHGIYLPNHSEITHDDIMYISKVVKKYSKAL